MLKREAHACVQQERTNTIARCHAEYQKRLDETLKARKAKAAGDVSALTADVKTLRAERERALEDFQNTKELLDVRMARITELEGELVAMVSFT